MSEQTINQIKPFRQVPSCEPDTLLTITGAEYADIQNVINVFKVPLLAVESIFNRNLNEGKIVIKYVQEDGTEIPQEQALEYLEQMKEFLKAKEQVSENQNIPEKPKAKSKLRKV